VDLPPARPREAEVAGNLPPAPLEFSGVLCLHPGKLPPSGHRRKTSKNQQVSALVGSSCRGCNLAGRWVLGKNALRDAAVVRGGLHALAEESQRLE
jgi:hypothetical protein